MNGLLPSYGWRGTFRIQSAILLGSVTLAGLLVKLPTAVQPQASASSTNQHAPSSQSTGNSNDTNITMPEPHPPQKRMVRSYFQLIQEPALIVIAVSGIAISFGYFIPFIYIV